MEIVVKRHKEDINCQTIAESGTYLTVTISCTQELEKVPLFDQEFDIAQTVTTYLRLSLCKFVLLSGQPVQHL